MTDTYNPETEKMVTYANRIRAIVLEAYQNGIALTVTSGTNEQNPEVLPEGSNRFHQVIITVPYMSYIHPVLNKPLCVNARAVINNVDGQARIMLPEKVDTQRLA